MRSKAIMGARILLGLVFLAFGVNYFLGLFPLPAMQGAAGRFFDGLVASRYLLPLLFATYVFAGAALVIGRFVPLALIVLAPIIVNVVAIHLVTEPSVTGLVPGLLCLALEVFLAWSYGAAFRPLLHARHELETT
jgi:uncharacterized membrane protein YphA (DoxX/SURF4 family)